MDAIKKVMELVTAAVIEPFTQRTVYSSRAEKTFNLTRWNRIEIGPGVFTVYLSQLLFKEGDSRGI